MIEFLFAAIVVLIAFCAMSIGVIAGRGPIRGGCAGGGTCDGHCAKRCENHRNEAGG
jgi:hypothetical protein